MGKKRNKIEKRLRRLLEQTEDKKPARRIRALEAELAKASARLTEALSVSWGGTGEQTYVTEDPVTDDGEVWDEIGVRMINSRRSPQRRMTLINLQRAISIGRWLSEENEYVIGAMTNRVSYVVGGGLKWKVVPRDQFQDGSGPVDLKSLMRSYSNALEEFDRQERMALREQEWVWRTDRDGEARLRIFPNGYGLPRVRFFEPELLRPPANFEGRDGSPASHARGLGVEVDEQDAESVRGYWAAGYRDEDPQFVPAWTAGLGIRAVVEGKLNVDLASPRGWPSGWPIRRGMVRSEKLLRNMSWVAALQAAIALIRKHETATSSQITSFVADHAALTETNETTGATTQHRTIRPGSIIDAGPGITYESPVSTINAGNNVAVLGAELRAGAVSFVQPGYMFHGDPGGGGYATTLVTDGPPSKNFIRMQQVHFGPLHDVRWAMFQHEVAWGRLEADGLRYLRLEADFPSTVVRDMLQETQRRDVMFQRGIISRARWRGWEGINSEEEDRHLDREAARGYTDARKGQVTEAKPAPGTTPGGAGGSDQRGNPQRPDTAPAESKPTISRIAPSAG